MAVTDPRVARDPDAREAPMPVPRRAALDARTRALGQVGYDAYREAVKESLPTWDTIPERIRRGWMAAADAVRNDVQQSTR